MSLSEKRLAEIQERVARRAGCPGDTAELLAEVERLRAGIEALVTTYRIRWDEDGDMDAHGYADDLLDLLNPTEGDHR